jgi:hypothetical protein
MDTQRLSLRDRLIGAGLLRPADPDEKTTAQQKCVSSTSKPLHARAFVPAPGSMPN